MKNPDRLRFVAFNPDGMEVVGSHNSAAAPVLHGLQPLFEQKRTAWRERLAAGAGYDGARAVLQDFTLTGQQLKLETAFRSYAEGRALQDAWVESKAHRMLGRPDTVLKGASWGMSLQTCVALPFGHILCAQRAEHLLFEPGKWTARLTEIVEPGDVQPKGMRCLLDRLVSEELASLVGLAGRGAHRYVGLAVKEASYGWHLISVLDLREPTDALRDALAALAPDEETQAFAAWSPHPGDAASAWFPDNLRRPFKVTPLEARDVAGVVTAAFKGR